MLGHAAVRIPAAQHMLDAGIGRNGVVRGMRPVHGGDIGHHGRSDVVVVVGCDLHTARALDQPRGVAHESQTHLGGTERGKAHRRRLHHRGRPRDREAAIRYLRRDGPRPHHPHKYGRYSQQRTRRTHPSLPQRPRAQDDMCSRRHPPPARAVVAGRRIVNVYERRLAGTALSAWGRNSAGGPLNSTISMTYLTAIW